MFTKSKNNVISMVRGDSASFYVTLNLGTVIEPNNYKLKLGDKVYFGVMEAHQSFEDAILTKVLTIDDVDEEGDVLITLEPTDTEYLLPGNYYYSVKLEINQLGNYRVQTIIPKRKFILED